MGGSGGEGIPERECDMGPGPAEHGQRQQATGAPDGRVQRPAGEELGVTGRVRTVPGRRPGTGPFGEFEAEHLGPVGEQGQRGGPASVLGGGP